MRNSRFLSGLPDTPGAFVDDDIVVCCIPAEQASDADDGIVFPSFRQRASG
jgi:hypothetical protein